MGVDEKNFSVKRKHGAINRYLNHYKKYGKGLIDKIIDKLPVELHVPTYQYCGPGTHLQKRLERGDPGKNPLDAACKIHDIAYSRYKDSNERSKADKILQSEALRRVFSRDASFGERAVAFGVAAAMKVKRKLSGKGIGKKRAFNRKKCNKTNFEGGGFARKRKQVRKKKTISFGFLVKQAKLAIKHHRPENIRSAINVALSSAKKHKRGKHVREPRTIKLPSIKGGILPLVPIFAGLGALGSIIGSTAGVVNLIKQSRRGQMELEENKRHNKTMESIAIGNKVGNGYFLHANKRGHGYFLASRPKNR